MILISKQRIFYVVKYQCKLCRTNAYVHVNQYMYQFAAILKQHCTYVMENNCNF